MTQCGNTSPVAATVYDAKMQVITHKATILTLALITPRPLAAARAQGPKYDGHQRTSFYVAVRDGTSDSLGLPWHSHTSADAQPLMPGSVAEVEFEMLPMSYIFKTGHRLRLSLFFADLAAPTSPNTTMAITVFRAPDMPSSVTLPLISAGSATGRR